MTAKHTPGPWKVEAEGVYIGAEDGFRPFGGCGCCGSPWMSADDEKVQLADARLISAAPDLLEALERLERTAGIAAATDDPARAAARAAIAKAKGAHND